jgi:hypothetical protein
MGTDEDAAFEYRGWRVTMETGAAQEMFSGHADLFCNGEHKCRLVLATPRADGVSARWALDSKARNYIDSWAERVHTGDTGLQEL